MNVSSESFRIIQVSTFMETFFVRCIFDVLAVGHECLKPLMLLFHRCKGWKKPTLSTAHAPRVPLRLSLFLAHPLHLLLCRRS